VIAGRTDAQTAACVGVHRVTVTRWRLSHPVFRSAVLAAHESDYAAAAAARQTLYRAALDRLKREVDDDGPRAVQVALAIVADPPPAAKYVSADTLAEEAHAAHLRGMLFSTYVSTCRRFGVDNDPFAFMADAVLNICGEDADACTEDIDAGPEEAGAEQAADAG
jgi:hypothetical protein